MKKFVIIFLLLAFAFGGVAQSWLQIPPRIGNKSVLSPKWNGSGELPCKPVNSTVNSTKMVSDFNIGDSRYDGQTYGSMMNRMIVWPDNHFSTVFTMGMADTLYNDRGTGYNYFDGVTWSPAPSARIETVRTGWPNLNIWMGNGEIVIAHNATATLVMNTRPVRGTGAWTQTLAPAAPAGITKLLFPHICTSGNIYQSIHILALGQPDYQGLHNALLYFRSQDGGSNWDTRGVVLPGLTSADLSGVGADDYDWATPHGDTIAFVISGNWEDGIIMKSFNNGSTWTKITYYHNPYRLSTSSAVVPPFWCLDGSAAIQLDHLGKAHVATGRMRARCDGSSRYYFPGTDGLVCWNENMPAFDTMRLRSLDSLDAHKQLVGYIDPGYIGDTIAGIPCYGVGLSSFPRILLYGNNEDVFYLWSGLVLGNPDPTPLNYRHTMTRRYRSSNNFFYNAVDWNEDFLYIFQEFAFHSIGNRLVYNSLVPCFYETSPQPGSNILDPTVPVHDVNIVFRGDIAVGIANRPTVGDHRVGGIFPNPVHSVAGINLSLASPGNVNLVVTDDAGRQVLHFDKGLMSQGPHRLTLDCAGLARGFYLVTITINGENFTQKMIKE